ncbi:peptidoglycan DD-metalloendopeptidase family protein [Bacteroidales bacterium OttesenSCG-928-K03]|nr:peptidoglycan DD-metalloendopeptidase family protein [Odoribacter sp. OttesenSCG-928-L07]MDL2239431.1 peptidoglycan DD-metalloendopeptidase family protein [Bacteroidales bacterium OttesenSCG-928-L14]MDL2241103.1 peptidoglycan DD-metalloendopeptidase family protein [Bacteroidales bacterium OttesenSCG-928-K22]MDL2242220.1 peptidoglycan DD-metalloendopeptidase family protein [Bacteroidales bacterium OttesenSCG-928-K03]
MFRIKKILSLIVIAIISCNCLLFAQSKEDLQNEKAKLEDEIQLTNKLLNQTLSGKKTSTEQVTLINKKINDRTKLISTINKEVKYLDNDISSTSKTIKELDYELELLRKEYADMILHTWSTKNTYKRLSYIFASEDLNQAFRRISYFKSYSDKRKEYSKEIISKTNELQNKKFTLEKQKGEKENLRVTKEKETSALQAEKVEKNNTIQSLTKQEKELRNKIKNQQAALSKLNKEIERIIAEEIKSRGTSGRLELTPEEKIISGQFEGNKGKLPWPCERGIISESFGTKAHPELKDIKINSTGVDILTEAKSMARAIFNGKVTKVTQIPQYNNVVIIRHGDFLTVYANLDEVLVSVGEEIKTKQNIGTIYSNSSEGTTKLHFEVWKGSTLLDPEHWIIKR